jgi:hypothetical protein
MTRLQHENVVGLTEVINDKKSDCLCLIQE